MGLRYFTSKKLIWWCWTFAKFYFFYESFSFISNVNICDCHQATFYTTFTRRATNYFTWYCKNFHLQSQWKINISSFDFSWMREKGRKSFLFACVLSKKSFLLFAPRTLIYHASLLLVSFYVTQFNPFYILYIWWELLLCCLFVSPRLWMLTKNVFYSAPVHFRFLRVSSTFRPSLLPRYHRASITNEFRHSE